MAERIQSRNHGRFSSVKSTCISNANYNPISGTLSVTFHNPSIGTWEYFNVDPYTAAGFMTASSRGQYLNAYIKGVFAYSRVD